MSRIGRGRPEPVTRCMECGWRPGEHYPPSRVALAMGEFVCGSTVTSEIGSLSFDDLSARDATALAKIAKIELTGSLTRVPGDVLGIDSPEDRLAASFAWLLQAEPGAGLAGAEKHWELDLSATWASAVAADIPWWAWFRDGAGLFVPLGLPMSLRIDAVQAVIASTILEVRDGAELRRSADGPRSVFFRKPVIAVGAAELDPVGGVQSIAHRAFRQGERSSPGELAARYASWLRETAIAEPPPEQLVISIDRTGPSAWQVMLSDPLAHDREEEVTRFVEALDAQREVQSVTHEDRELILVDIDDEHSDWLVSFTRAWWHDRAGVTEIGPEA